MLGILGDTWGYYLFLGGDTWGYLGILGDTWGYLGIPGDTWGYLGIPGGTYLVSPRLNTFQTKMGYLYKLLNEIWHYIFNEIYIITTGSDT